MTLTTVNSDGVKDGSIKNIDVKSDAAIAGSKIAPDFDSQDITTTGDISIGGSIGLSGTENTAPTGGGLHRHTNGWTYFTGKADGNGATLSNGDGTATVKAISPGGSNGYVTMETGDGTERMRITTDGNVGIGTDDPFAPTNFTCLEISGTTGGCITFSDDEVPQWEIYGDSGDLAFYHRNHSPSAAIACINISANGNVSLPTGNLILANGKGIDFAAQTTSSATGATAATSAGDEVLDHYERGVWIPADGSTGGLSITVHSASYLRVGDLVFINAYITYPSTTDTANAKLTNIPFAAKWNNYSYLCGRIMGLTLTLNAQVNGGTSDIELYAEDSIKTNANLSGKYVLFSGCYTIA
tara:strand:- start:50 stop:1117 length:1068 start_codon:yes stop_codon:yes gene_type:complete